MTPGCRLHNLKNTLRKSTLTLIGVVGLSLVLNAQQRNDIIGEWISSHRNVIVKIYYDSTDYKGAVVWFDDTDDESSPMHSRKDLKNPNRNLRNQHIIGLDVLKDLQFNPRCSCWQDGKIYDVQTGKTWSASISMENINKLKVRGFWHYEFIGRSMTFKRVK